MNVLVAGGHGQIALRLLKLLAERGDTARGIIRNPDHAADLEAVGAEAVVCDLESEDPTEHVRGSDAIVFAAGAGPGSGPERKRTVDYGAAVKLIDAAEATGVRRYVIVSSVGAHDPAAGGESMGAYLEAKAEADEALMHSGLDWTVVRPGQLHDDAGDGKVAVSTELGGRGPIARDDVAAVLAACLDDPDTIGKVFELFDGETPVAEALRAL
jgi:uncharacterized protein YbjT (DUF2867 family)